MAGGASPRALGSWPCQLHDRTSACPLGLLAPASYAGYSCIQGAQVTEPCKLAILVQNGGFKAALLC